jgi:predicted DNA-binding protein
MSATRTQIYLSDEQRRRIDELAMVEGVTMAEVIRRAVDAYVVEGKPDPSHALEVTFGADPAAAAPSRDEWDRG